MDFSQFPYRFVNTSSGLPDLRPDQREVTKQQIKEELFFWHFFQWELIPISPSGFCLRHLSLRHLDRILEKFREYIDINATLKINKMKILLRTMFAIKHTKIFLEIKVHQLLNTYWFCYNCGYLYFRMGFLCEDLLICWDCCLFKFRRRKMFKGH